MSEIDQIFFELIRLSVGSQEHLSRVPSAAEWSELYSMAEKQAVLGVCFVGVSQSANPDEEDYAGMPESLYYKWVGSALQIQQRNEALNAQCIQVQKMLSDAGFRSSILKGQGMATLYGVSSTLRQSGDIDVYVNGGIKCALAFAKSRFGKVDFDYINARLPVFDATEVELHWRVRSMSNLFRNHRLQKWTAANEEELFEGNAILPDGQIVVVPSMPFNRFYILHHIHSHLFSEGVGLRQLMDYYFVLESEDVSEGEKVRLCSLLKYFGMTKFAGALMWALSEVFGLEEERMIIAPDAKEGKFFFDEIMSGGNFGHHYSRTKRVFKNGRWQSIWSMIQHNLRLVPHYPSEALWAPVWIVWHWCWKRINIIKMHLCPEK